MTNYIKTLFTKDFWECRVDNSIVPEQKIRMFIFVLATLLTVISLFFSLGWAIAFACLGFFVACFEQDYQSLNTKKK